MFWILDQILIFICFPLIFFLYRNLFRSVNEVDQILKFNILFLRVMDFFSRQFQRIRFCGEC